ncbi:hypothetical protein JMJ35_004833 [Cladonia borealis]|uniref:CN hydrolase domain-containing protein n=1 Tax=Cladonia borealis TaxID=184061 RepID=A0AA39UAW1_9LECA|nr:hypothetical protein JMJ35_004833 [Cladonia borealis]
MRIACLQFSPKLGKPAENVARANVILEAASPPDIDLLVLPELAFTGYNFPSLVAILPHLEPTSAGLSTTWAKTVASQYNCIVTVGYPELYSPSTSANSPNFTNQILAYNSTVTVAPNGQILAHYRKTHLYYTDETWAQESPEGWLSTPLTFAPKTESEKFVQASFGICMDLNPYQFTAPWEAYEFCAHALAKESEILVLSMAWLTRLPEQDLLEQAEEPDLNTLSYWIERMKPLVDGEKEVIVVCANRSGMEPGKNPIGEEEGVRYAGSSWVGKVGRGVVRIWQITGKAIEQVIVADTKVTPQWELRMKSGIEGETCLLVEPELGSEGFQQRNSPSREKRHLLDAIRTNPVNKKVLSLVSPSFRPFNALTTSSASIYIALVHLAQLGVLIEQREQIDKAEQPNRTNNENDLHEFLCKCTACWTRDNNSHSDLRQRR